MTESPADTIRRAAALMRKRAREATPGPWERPLDVRGKNIVIAELPGNEPPGHWDDGVIPENVTWGGLEQRYAGQRERCGIVSAGTSTTGGFTRKRSGRDLEYIAAMHPQVALAMARLLEYEASLLDTQAHPQADGRTAGYPLAVALAYLGEEEDRTLDLE